MIKRALINLIFKIFEFRYSTVYRDLNIFAPILFYYSEPSMSDISMISIQSHNYLNLSCSFVDTLYNVIIRPLTCSCMHDHLALGMVERIKIT